jgi:hypothetical protein
MSGTIAIPANDAARYTFFAASLTSLVHPPNTAVRWAFGSDRIRGRNNLVRESLELGSEWLWFLDDDHAFPPWMLMRLLNWFDTRDDVDIVSPIYLQRMMPFAPVVYTHQDEKGDYVPLFLPDYPTSFDDPLVKVHAAGTGGMLIRTSVFEMMPEPWFEHGHASEDLIFCEKARDLGYDIWCDLSSWLGHITTTVIWPSINGENDGWDVGFTVADKLNLTVQIGTRDQLEELERQEQES